MNKVDTRERSVWLALPWLVGGAFTLFVMLLDYSTSKGVVIGGAEIWPRDYVNLWAGGKLIAARDFVTLYTPATFSDFLDTLFGPVGPHVYSYPPTAFPIADLFARLPYALSAILWLGATGAIFIVAARPWWPAAGGWIGLVVLTPAALVNLWTGHYAFVLGGLFLIAWRLIDTRPVLAGVAIGLLAIKPQFAILIPFVLLLRGEWRAIGAASLTVMVMVGATALIYGVESWIEFKTRAAGNQVSVIDAQGAFFGKMSASAATAVLDAGGSWTLALGAQGALAVFGLALVTLAVRMRVATADLALLTATVTFLVLPYSITYDLVVPMIAAWAIMVRQGVPVLDRGLATIGFVAPQIGIVLALIGLPITSLMIAGLALAQYRVATRA